MKPDEQLSLFSEMDRGRAVEEDSTGARQDVRAATTGSAKVIPFGLVRRPTTVRSPEDGDLLSRILNRSKLF